MTPDLYRKQKGSSSSYNIAIYHKWKLSAIPKLRYRDHKVFGLWPLVTSNNLWPPPKTIGFFQSTWQSYIKYENCRPLLSRDTAITSHQGGGKASDWLGEGAKALSSQSSSQNNKSIYRIWKVLIITILRNRDYKPFSQFKFLSPQMTSDLYQKQ